uniref:Uncharacterized protein n=1 Tax=Acinetobacter nosocomialis TaxID=106654 RepID=A0A7S9DQE7_ACINO|nr:hypothetical protein WM98B_00145 [Acinetobacter nosocomialis]
MLDQGRAFGDQRPVPPRTVLLVEEHQIALRGRARIAARLLQQHQRKQPDGLRFGEQLGEQTAKPDRLGRQVGARQRLAGRGRVALVEHQIDHAQYAVEPGRQRGRLRHFIGHARIADLALGAHDALRERGRCDEEGTCDLLGGEAAYLAQRQRHLRLGRQHRMAAGEDQPQAVILDAVVVGLFARQVGPVIEVVNEIEPCPPSQAVDRLEAAGRHQPGARIGRHTLSRPLLERDTKGIVQRLLREIEVAEQANQRREQPARLGPVDHLQLLAHCPCRSGRRFRQGLVRFVR